MPTFIEVCSGCGGLSTGLIEAGFTPLFLNEIDKTCVDTLKKNHQDIKIIEKDMRDLDIKNIESPDLLCGGVPCQSFSQAGKRKGLDDPRRLSLDEPCLTLTTSPCQKQTERIHPLETRPFTVREYARIQSFPDSYVFSGSKMNQYKQIGNAVPPKLGKAVGKSINKLFE